MKNTEKLRVFIDSKSFAELLEKDDRTAGAILQYHNSKLLDLVRDPLEADFKELKNVVEYEPQFNKDGKLISIKIVRDKSEQIIGTRYRKEDILSTINITNNDTLLKKRRYSELHFPGGPLNIMSVEEATLFLDLFFKKNGNYLFSNNSLNKGYWYLLSMRLKLPHYNVGDPLINALSDKFYYALMALDEIGIQYYLGQNNDTMDNTLYHFYYWISLVTGIFDNLALKTDSALGINFPNQIRISLHNTNGKDFLKEVRKKSPQIRAHINSGVEFINLIYLFRERVIHREGLPKTGFENRDKDGSWKANFIKVTEEIKKNLRACGDKKSQYDPFTEWGLYEMHSQYFLDPYNFSMNATRKLTEFTDKYLELLGYPSFIEAQKQKSDDFTKTLTAFEKYHLGF